MVEAIRANQIEANWHWLEPLISPSLDKTLNETSLEHIKAKAISGDVLFLVFKQVEVLGVATVEVVDYPDKSILYCSQLSGRNIDLWLSELIETLDSLAKDKNIKEIEMTGRKGWVKKLTPYGFKEQYITMVRKL